MINFNTTVTSFILISLLSFSCANASDLDEFNNEDSSEQGITVNYQEEATETEVTVEVQDYNELSDKYESMDSTELNESTENVENEGFAESTESVERNELAESSGIVGNTELIESTEVLERSSLEKAEVRDYKWRLSGRYLGVLSLGGLERAISEQLSLGLFYGRYQGKVPGSDKSGLVPGLRSFALQGSAYLGKSKRVFSNGIVAKFGLTYNTQEENPDIKSIQVDGEDVILPGESKIGSLLGIGYHYRWKRLSASVGVEYVTLGSLQSFVPLALTLGLTF